MGVLAVKFFNRKDAKGREGARRCVVSGIARFFIAKLAKKQ